MSSKIVPGILAVVVRGNYEIRTPELIGRIVTVVRRAHNGEKFLSICGRRRVALVETEDPWVIAANSPLPWRLREGGLFEFIERPLWSGMLKPLNDPDLGVTDEEVEKLYSPSVDKVANESFTF